MLVKRLLVDAGDPELLHYEEARALYRKEFDKAKDVCEKFSSKDKESSLSIYIRDLKK